MIRIYCSERIRNPCCRLLKTVLFLLVLSITAQQPAFCVETIQIGGTGGGLSAIRLLAADFERKHPGIKIKILPSMGSTGGIKAVLAGAVDIGLSARVLNDAESGAVAQEYARTPFVFAVQKNNDLNSGFAFQELVDIYAGKITTWPDARPIRLVLRPVTEYDNTLLKNMSEEMKFSVQKALSRPGMIIEITDQENARALEKIPGALGTITLGQIQSEKRFLKALPLDGVKPSTKTLMDGTYRYFKNYYIVTKPDLRPVVRKFIDFMYSAAARRVLAGSAYIVGQRPQ